MVIQVLISRHVAEVEQRAGPLSVFDCVACEISTVSMLLQSGGHRQNGNVNHQPDESVSGSCLPLISLMPLPSDLTLR